MIEFIKKLLRCFKNNKVNIEDIVKSNINIDRDIYPISECSSEDFNVENYDVIVLTRIIKNQKKIFRDIIKGKIELDRYTYISIKTNHENFFDVLKSIKNENVKENYIFEYSKNLDKFNKLNKNNSNYLKDGKLIFKN
jgi:hypothetical protein